MKGYAFYLEFPDKKARRKATRANIEGNSGTVVAVMLPYSWIPGSTCMEAFSAVYDEKNSPVCFTSCAQEYLDERCLRISEKVAREVHPELFKRLDD